MSLSNIFLIVLLFMPTLHAKPISKPKRLFDKQRYERAIEVIEKTLTTKADKLSVEEWEELQDLLENAYYMWCGQQDTASIWLECLEEYPTSNFLVQARNQSDKSPVLHDLELERLRPNQSVDAWKEFLSGYALYSGRQNDIDEFESYHFQVVTEENTLSAFKYFITTHPEGKFIEQARVVHEDMLFKSVQENGKAALSLNVGEDADTQELKKAYQLAMEFLKEYPESSSKAEVIALLEEVEYRIVSITNTSKNWRLFLERYPEGKYVEEAQAALKAALFATASELNTVDSWTTYLTNHPEDSRATEALQESHYQNARLEDTVVTWRAYLERFPESPQRENALERYHLQHWNEARFINTIEEWTSLIEDSIPHPKMQDARIMRGKIYLQAGLALEGSSSAAIAMEHMDNACKDGALEGCYHHALTQIDMEKTISGIAILAKSCKDGYGASCAEVGDMYLSGRHVSASRTKAIGYLKTGCRLGNVSSCSNLATIWEEGRRPVSSSEAKEFATALAPYCNESRPALCRKLADEQSGLPGNFNKWFKDILGSVRWNFSSSGEEGHHEEYFDEEPIKPAFSVGDEVQIKWANYPYNGVITGVINDGNDGYVSYKFQFKHDEASSTAETAAIVEVSEWELSKASPIKALETVPVHFWLNSYATVLRGVSGQVGPSTTSSKPTTDALVIFQKRMEEVYYPQLDECFNTSVPKDIPLFINTSLMFEIQDQSINHFSYSALDLQSSEADGCLQQLIAQWSFPNIDNLNVDYPLVWGKKLHHDNINVRVYGQDAEEITKRGVELLGNEASRLGFVAVKNVKVSKLDCESTGGCFGNFEGIAFRPHPKVVYSGGPESAGLPLYEKACSRSDLPSEQQTDDREWSCYIAGMQRYYKRVTNWQDRNQDTQMIPGSTPSGHPDFRLTARRCLLGGAKKSWEKKSCLFAGVYLHNVYESWQDADPSHSLKKGDLSFFGNMFASVCDNSVGSVDAPGFYGGTVHANSFCVQAAEIYGSYEKNKEKELFYNKKGCEKGDALGCSFVAAQYSSITPPDYINKNVYLDKGCKLKDAAACNYLGLAYSQGEGILKNETTAATYYKKACSSGLPVSCFNVGIMYNNGAFGRGQSQDSQYRQYMDKSCHMGYGDACAKLYAAHYYSEGTGGVTGGNANRQMAVLNGVSVTAQSGYDRVIFSFQPGIYGTPQFQGSYRRENGKLYLFVEFVATQGVHMVDTSSGPRVRRSYPSNRVTGSGTRVVSRVSNAGKSDGHATDNKIVWKIQMKKNKFPNLLVLSQPRSTDLILDFIKK
jgi:TPR repeat protein/outer membrane protein assembly factor BamD (BamD/ComL family)